MGLRGCTYRNSDHGQSPPDLPYPLCPLYQGQRMLGRFRQTCVQELGSNNLARASRPCGRARGVLGFRDPYLCRKLDVYLSLSGTGCAGNYHAASIPDSNAGVCRGEHTDRESYWRRTPGAGENRSESSAGHGMLCWCRKYYLADRTEGLSSQAVYTRRRGTEFGLQRPSSLRRISVIRCHCRELQWDPEGYWKAAIRRTGLSVGVLRGNNKSSPPPFKSFGKKKQVKDQLNVGKQVGIPISFGTGFGLHWHLYGLWAGPAVALIL